MPDGIHALAQARGVLAGSLQRYAVQISAHVDRTVYVTAVGQADAERQACEGLPIELTTTRMADDAGLTFRRVTHYRPGDSQAMRWAQ